MMLEERRTKKKNQRTAKKGPSRIIYEIQSFIHFLTLNQGVFFIVDTESFNFPKRFLPKSYLQFCYGLD